MFLAMPGPMPATYWSKDVEAVFSSTPTNLFIENRSDPDKDWHIETEGEVTPSVFCHGLVNGPECGYHEFIKLESWNSWKHHPHKQ
jgi:hypothetical protein